MIREKVIADGLKVDKAKLPVIFMGMMLLAGCSGSNNKEVVAVSQMQKVDSATRESQDPSAEAVATPDVFDRLASDMVFVEWGKGDFYICKYEVTQELWKEVMGGNPSQMQGDDLPVEQVSWNDCQVFIGKLNELTGKTYRLPTEAEWEYACRGGKYSKGYSFSGSNDIDDVAWYDGNSGDKSHPVGQKRPNELGLYDMSGNVWEWCEDFHEPSRVCRGGSWIHNARNCDPSLDNETPPAFRINSLGLRLARSF